MPYSVSLTTGSTLNPDLSWATLTTHKMFLGPTAVTGGSLKLLAAETIKNLSALSGDAYKKSGAIFSRDPLNPVPKIDTMTPVVLSFRGAWPLSGGMEISKNSD
jgi:hypothetical protein